MSGVALGLGLALVASLALNGSYVVQHVGSGSAPPVDPRHPVATLLGLLRSRAWVAGGALGLGGWGMHVAALANAPLSLVQAFVAGGLAVMAPVASRVLRHPLSRAEWAGVAIVVVSLGLLCVGLGNPTVNAAVRIGPMVGFLAACAAAVGLLTRAAPRWRPHALGLAGGLLYGAADVAIKTLTSIAHAHGLARMALSPWVVVAAGATIGAFFAFQRGLQLGNAVPVIALMTAATTAVSVVGAFLVFGDSLGRTPAIVVLHLVAFVLVGVAAAALAPATAAEPAAYAGG